MIKDFEINCSILSFLENEKEINICDKYIIKRKAIKEKPT
jgi:hypothetical protein